MGKSPLQDVCLAVICGTPFIASMFVGLRLYARRKFSTHLGWGEFLESTDVFCWDLC